MTKKLKRCPWCGGRGRLMRWDDGCGEHVWSVTCPSGAMCEICPETKCHDSEESAITAWETRK